MTVLSRDQIVSDNEFFEQMLNLLPPQLITDREPEDDDTSGTDEDVEEEEEVTEKQSKQKNGKKNKMKKKDNKNSKTAGAGSVVSHAVESMEVEGDCEEDDLQIKLKKKLEALRALRSKPGSSEHDEKNRLKRRLSKAKLKERRKAEKKANTSSTTPNSSSSKQLANKTILSSGKPLDEDKIVFSKFEFKGTQGESLKADKAKKNKVLPTGKNYKQILEKIEKQKEKLVKLGEQDTKKAQDLKGKLLWKTAISKAEGVKVKDDVNLIKKSLKKKEKKSERGKKQWKEREEAVEKRMKARQDKRNTNISKRKDMKKEKIVKRNKKKGRLVGGN